MTPFMPHGKINHLKTLWQKEKRLITSIFSLSHFSVQSKKNALFEVHELFPTQFQLLKTLKKKPLGNIMRKGGILETSISSFFCSVFFQSLKEYPFTSYIYFVICKCFQFAIFILSLANAFNLHQSKKLSFGIKFVICKWFELENAKILSSSKGLTLFKKSPCFYVSAKQVF